MFYTPLWIFENLDFIVNGHRMYKWKSRKFFVLYSKTCNNQKETALVFHFYYYNLFFRVTNIEESRTVLFKYILLRFPNCSWCCINVILMIMIYMYIFLSYIYKIINLFKVKWFLNLRNLLSNKVAIAIHETMFCMCHHKI